MYDQITLDRIEKMHPDLRGQLKLDYLEINKKLPKGVRLRFSHTYRSIEEQNKLYNQRPRVSNAKGGQSMHNYGLAFDIVILHDLDNNGTFETASFKVDKHWMQVVDFFKAKGWFWGGNFKRFVDPPHFEVNGHKWQDLIKRKKFTDKNGLEYPFI